MTTSVFNSFHFSIQEKLFMSDERLQILQMLEEGKITVEEASSLLDALSDAPTPSAATEKRSVSLGKAKWMRIEITESNGNRVHVKLPMIIIQAALRLGGRFNIAGFDSEELGPEIMDALETALREGETGMLVDVTEKNGDHVEIYLE
ncbi:MAG: hypothetical protein DSY55_06865 [Clostridia bacterium]|nr:MAG: hypothetical protein DSY55_06865 [Clostridia bacterium]